MNKNKGAVLIEVLVALFITAVVFVGVYTTISISLINTKYLKQARETSEFATQIGEAFCACSNSAKYTIFDYIKDFFGQGAVVTEIDLEDAKNDLISNQAQGNDTLNFFDLIDDELANDYKIQLFLISPNAVYLSENSLGTPFGNGVYTPNDDLMTFELRVQKNSKDWGIGGYKIYKERQPAVISYIFQVNRRAS